jgi:hypothetical protein
VCRPNPEEARSIDSAVCFDLVRVNADFGIATGE